MSLSQPKLTNPATMFISWAGDESVNSWYHYDKDLKKKVFFKDTPIKIIILDQLSTVTGFCENEGCGVYSNEIKFAVEILTVKTFKGREIAKGTWKDIKKEVESKSNGGGYAKSVYAAMITKDGLKLVNVKFHGSALNWIEQHFREDGSIIELLNGDESTFKTKGKTEYYCPRYKRLPIDEKWTSIAIEMDRELQSYFAKYFGKMADDNLTKIDESAEIPTGDAPPEAIDPPHDDLPF
jgi:hypothetical protein